MGRRRQCARRPEVRGHRRLAALVIPSLLCITALLTTGMTASASTGIRTSADPGSRGGPRIVWSRFIDTDFSAARIVIGDPNGHGVRELTHSSDGVIDIDPQLSPNGSRVAFERDLPDGSAQIVVVGSDGRGEHALDLGCVHHCVADVTPSWTPDGHHLLFTRVIGPFDQPNNSARSAVLWRTDLQGRHVKRISEAGIDGAFEDYHASFAPDGYLVFVRVRNADVTSATFRMDFDGTHVRRLTPWSIDADLPSVSPARSGPTHNLVVFETFGHGQPHGIGQAVATVSAVRTGHGTGHVHYLTSPSHLPLQNFNPAWSPNGQRIAYVRFVFNGTSVRGDIWTMRWNGRNKQPVSRSPLFEFRPSWGYFQATDTRHSS
jgi:Tol biopolymer transport system component